MDKLLFILVGNAGYYNRGCEAITRGTVRILREFFSDPSFLVVSHYGGNQQFERDCVEEVDASITHKRMRTVNKKFDLLWFTRQTLKVICPNAIKHIMYKDVKPYLDEAKAVLSVGGDNYSLDYGRLPKICTDLDDLVIARGKPLVIWAASVGPFDRNPRYERYMMNHLRKVHILARETATIEYLARHQLTENVYRVADPAFLMEPVQPMEEKGRVDVEHGAIGLNLSPLMGRFLGDGNRENWIRISGDIISKILGKTDGKIYLIPHVTGNPANDDYLFLKNVVSRISHRKERDRIVLIGPVFNASETKWIISKMTVFAGARMHSTIAALSSCVPTLLLAYSMKAEGVSKDIYKHMDYCISSRELVPDIVAEKVVDLLQKSTDIRKHLERQMPEIRDLAMNSGRILKKILE